jgi:hypothetical protein
MGLGAAASHARTPSANRAAVFKEQGLFSVLVEERDRRNSVFALKSLLNVAEGVGGIQKNSAMRPLDDERRSPMLVLGGSSELND